MLTISTKYLEDEEVDALATIAVMFDSDNIENTIIDCVQFCYQVAMELGENGYIVVQNANCEIVK